MFQWAMGEYPWNHNNSSFGWNSVDFRAHKNQRFLLIYHTQKNLATNKQNSAILRNFMVENIGKYGLFRSGEIAFGEELYRSGQKPYLCLINVFTYL